MAPTLLTFGDAAKLPSNRRVAALGVKASNLVDIDALDGIDVPIGVIIPVDVAFELVRSDNRDGVAGALIGAVATMERHTGGVFGRDPRTLCLSVRSSGAVSMPGMMDTVLGVGSAPSPDAFGELTDAVAAVASSYLGERAIAFRAHRGLDEQGCAVLVQQMVWGNADDRSCSGVAFSRDPLTGAATMTGDVAMRAVGADVVGGRVRVEPLDSMRGPLPEVHGELADAVSRIERLLGGPCEVEFTVESGHLYVLQARISASATSAPGPSTSDEAGRPGRARLVARGVAASPGRARGVLVCDPDAVFDVVSAGEPVVLARPETSPVDVHAMVRSAAIITTFGGLASHAAVIARAEAIPAVVGIAEMDVRPTGIDTQNGWIAEGEWLEVDGTTGEVFVAERTE